MTSVYFDFRQKLIWILALAFLLFCVSPKIAFGLPSGFTTESGDVNFDLNQEGSSLVITASDHAIINFNDFSIAQHETVRFIQPFDNASVLSRVIGSNRSDIFGSLYANGQLVLVNPNGFYFAPQAQIYAGSLIASTLDIQSAMYQNNQFMFEKKFGYAPGSIVNEADISVSQGGHLVLLAEEIRNKGVLEAYKGTVALGVGTKASLSFDPYGLVNLVMEEGINYDYSQAPLTNEGIIRAQDGRILLTAKGLDQILNAIINNTGVIEAVGAVEHDGVIEFIAEGGAIQLGGSINLDLSAAFSADKVYVNGDISSSGGSVTVEGRERVELGSEAKITTPGGTVVLKSAEGTTLLNEGSTIDVSNSEIGEKGGRVEVLGEKVGLFGTQIDASGDSGGGTVLIGGDYKGMGSAQNAIITVVDSGSSIKADALAEGNGGKVIVWSDEATNFAGNISARGGILSGDGGFVEVSGHRLSETGDIDVSALAGSVGTILYDPASITILGSGAGVGQQDGSDDELSNVLFQEGGDSTVSFDEIVVSEAYSVYESEIELTNANMVFEARNFINSSGTFDSGLQLQPGVSISFLTRNASGEGSGGINLVAGTTGLFILTKGLNVLVGGGPEITEGTAGSVFFHAGTNGGDAGTASIALPTIIAQSITVIAEGSITGNGDLLTKNTYNGAGTWSSGNISLTSQTSSVILLDSVRTGARGRFDSAGTDVFSSGNISINAASAITGTFLETGVANFVSSVGGSNSATSGNITLNVTNGSVAFNDPISVYIGEATGTGAGSSATTGNLSIYASRVNNGTLGQPLNILVDSVSNPGGAATTGTVSVQTYGGAGSAGEIVLVQFVDDADLLISSLISSGNIDVEVSAGAPTNLIVSSASTTNGYIRFASVGSITTGTITTGGAVAGGLNLEADGDITLNGTVTVGGQIVTIDADRDDSGSGTFTISPTSSLSLLNNVFGISITADDIVLSGPMVGAGGTIFLRPSTTVTVGLGTVGGHFNLTDAELDSINLTGTLFIGSQGTAGAVTIDNLTLGNKNVEIGSTSTISDLDNAGANLVTTGTLRLRAMAGIGAGDFLDIDAGILDLARNGLLLSNVGDILIRDTTGNFTVNSAFAIDGAINLQAAGGNLILGTATAGGTNTVTLGAAGAIQDNNGAANNVTANELSATAVSGIDLDTTVNMVSLAQVTGAGVIDLHDLSGGLTVTNASTFNGNITIVSEDALSAILVMAQGAGSDVVLTSVAQNMDIGSVTADASVTLTSAGAIQDLNGAANNITAEDLSASSVFGIDLDTTIDDLDLATVSGTGSIDINDAGSGLSVTGASTANGNITIATQSGLLTAGPIVAQGAGSQVHLTADNMTLNGAVTAVDRVTVDAAAPGQIVDLGGPDTLTALGLSATELGNITAATLQVGSVNSGPILISVPVSPNVTTLSLVSDFNVVQTAAGAITVPELKLDVDTSSDLAQAVNNVGVLAAVVQNPGAFLNFTDADGFAVGTVDGVSGITTNNGDIDLTTLLGSMTFNAPVDAGTANVSLTATFGSLTNNNIVLNNIIAGSLSLTAATGIDLDVSVNTILSAEVTGNGNMAISDAVGGFTVTSASTFAGDIDLSAQLSLVADSITAGGGGDITLTSNAIDFIGPNMISGTAGLTLQPYSASGDINIAGGITPGLDITSAELIFISNGFSLITIGRVDGTGAITIGAADFFDPVLIQSPLPGGTITVNGLLRGLDNASITLDGPGATTTLNADIFTAGNEITISDSVLLGTPALVTLDTTNAGAVPTGADITVDGTVNDTGAASSLTARTGTAGTLTFQSAVGAGTPFQDLTTIGNVDLNSTMHLFGNLTHSVGMFDPAANAIDVDGNVTSLSGTFNAPSTTMNVGGNWNTPSGFDANGGTVIFDATDTNNTILTNTGLFNSFFNVTFNDGGFGGKWTLVAPFRYDGGTLNILSGDLDVSTSDYYIGAYGSWSNSGTFNPQNGLVYFGVDASGTVDNGSSLFYDVAFWHGPWTLTNDLHVIRNILITSPLVATNTLEAGSNTIDVGGDWTNQATFDAGTSEVILNGTGPQNLTSGGDSFNDLTINKTVGTTVDQLDGLTVTGIFDLVQGDFNSPTNFDFTAFDFRLSGADANNTFYRYDLANANPPGSVTNPYLIIDIYGLQAMKSYLSSNFALSNDITATGTSAWNSSAGFVPIGDPSGGSPTWFNGNFDGNNRTITGLYINNPTLDYVGLFGINFYTSVISDVGLLNTNVTGDFFVGALVGWNNGSITNSYSSGSGTITGGNTVGGLVGWDDGAAISNSHSTQNVFGTTMVGGLVGYQSAYSAGEISNSYATGSVSGGDIVGGLVGKNLATIFQSYFIGSVNGTNGVGGFVGNNEGSISESYVTGNVTAAGFYIGGFVGENNGLGVISDSYAQVNVDGGVVADVVGGFVGNSSGAISRSYAAGSVSGDTFLGGFVGYDNDSQSTYSNNFWDHQISGLGSSDDTGNLGSVDDITGQTTAIMKMSTTFTSATWDFATVWDIVENVTYPYFDWQDLYSGTVYSDTGVTLIGAGKNIVLLINGALAGNTLTNASGQYFMPGGGFGSGDAILVYINNDAIDGNTVTLAAGASIAGLDIYGSNLIVRHEGAGPISNSDLVTAKGAQVDADILYTVTGAADIDTTTVVPTTDFYLWPGKTYAPGGELTTHDVTITSGAVINAGASAIQVSGDWLNSGTFNAGTSTVTFDGIVDQTLQNGGSSFHHLIINNSGPGDTPGLGDHDVVVSGVLDVNGDLTLTDGALDLYTNSASLDLEGDMALASGAYLSWGNGGTINTAGDVTFNAGSGQASSSTNAMWTFDGASGTQIFLPDSFFSFSNVNMIHQGAATLQLAGNLTLSGFPASSFTNSSGVFDLNGFDFTINGNLTNASGATITFGNGVIHAAGDFLNSGNINAGTGTVRFNGPATSDQTFTTGGATYNDIVIDRANNTNAVVVSGNLNINGNLTLNSSVLDIFTNGADLDLEGDWTETGVGAGSSYLKWGSASSLNTAGNVTFAGGIGQSVSGANSGTWIFDSSDNQTLNTNNLTIGKVHLVHQGPGSLILVNNSLNLQPGGDAASLTNSSGTVSLNGQNLTVNGAFSNDGTIQLFGSETVTLSTGNDTDSGFWLYTGDGDGISENFTLYNNPAGDDYFNLFISDPDLIAKDNFNPPTNLKINGVFAIFDGTFNGSGTGSVMDVDGNLDVIGGTFNAPTDLNLGQNFTRSGGTFDHDSNTVTFDGTGPQFITSNGAIFFDLDHTGAGTIVLADGLLVSNDLTQSNGIWTSGANAIDVDGDFSNTTANAFSAPSTTMNVGGDWNANSIEPNGGTIILDGTGAHTFTNPFGQLFNVTFNNSLGTWTLGGNILDVSGTLNILSGELDVSLNNYSIASYGDWTNSGSFTPRLGTVYFPNRPAFGAHTINNGTSSFYDVEIYDVNGAGVSPTWTLTNSLDVDHNFSLTSSGPNVPVFNAAGNAMTIGGNWLNTAIFNPGGNTVTFDGGDQSISGNTTFNNLTKTPGVAATLTFQAGSTQKILGALTLQGASGSDLLSLESSVPGNFWLIDPQGARNISFVDVSDSINVRLPVFAATAGDINSVDSGNNINWFGDGTIVNGTIWTGFADEDYGNVENWSNGIVPGAVDDVFVPSTLNDPALDNSSREVNDLTILVDATLDLSGLNYVINGDLFLSGTLDATGTPVITVGGDWTSDGNFIQGDSEVIFDGICQAINGNNTFNDLTKIVPDNATTYCLIFEAGSTTTILGDLVLQGFDGPTDNLLGLESSIPGTQWILNTQNADSVTGISLVDVSDSINLGAPIDLLDPPNMDAGNNINWFLNGFNFDGAIWVGFVDTDWDTLANWAANAIPLVTDNVLIQGSVPFDPTIDDFGRTTNDLVIEVAGVLTLDGFNLTVMDDLEVSGTLDASAGTPTITVSGDWINQDGVFIAGSSTVVFNDASQTSILDAPLTGLSFFNFTSTTPDKVLIFTQGDTFNIGGTWTLDGGDAVGDEIVLQSSAPGALWYVNPFAVSIEDVAVSDSFNTSGTVPVISPASSVDVSNNFNWFSLSSIFIWQGDDLTDPTFWSDSDNWSSGSIPGIGDSALIPTGLLNYPILTTSLTEVGNLTILSGAFVDLVDRDFTVDNILSNQGTIKLQGLDSQAIDTNDLSAGGMIEYTGSGVITGLRAGNGYFDLLFSGTGTYNLDNALGVAGTLTNAGSTVNAAGFIVTANNVVLSSGLFTAPSTTMSVSGDWTNNAGPAAFGPNGGTVLLKGTLQSLFGNTTFNNLTNIELVGPDTLTFEAGSTTTILGNLTLQGLDSGNRLILQSSNPPFQWVINTQAANTSGTDFVDVRDSVNVGPVIDPSGSTGNANIINWFSAGPGIVFSGAIWVGAEDELYQNPNNWAAQLVPTNVEDILIQGNVANDPLLDNSLRGSDDLTLETGAVFDLNGLTYTITGDLINRGTLDTVGSTVILAGLGQSLFGNTTFNNLTSIETGPDTLTFEAGSTTTILGNLTLQGLDSVDRLILQSSNPPFQWVINTQAANTSGTDFVDVRDSVNVGPVIDPSGSTGNANIINWFSAGPGIVFSGAIWVGAENSDWDDVGNWAAGIIPTGGDDTLIQDNVLNNPAFLSDTNQAVDDLTLEDNAVLTLNGFDFDINGSLLNNGTLDAAGDSVITVGGNWTNNDVFNAGSSSVIFDSTTVCQEINGDTTFFNFEKIVPDNTAVGCLIFEAGSKQTILGDLILQGFSGNLLSLESSVVGSPWVINTGGAAGTLDVDLVDVSDSINLGAVFAATPAAIGSVDSGNNINWFGSGVVFGGFIWIGSQDIHYENGTNWAQNAFPTSLDDALILGSALNQPTLFDDRSIHDLTIQSGATFTTDGYDYAVSGSLNNSGTLDISSVNNGGTTLTLSGDFLSNTGVFLPGPISTVLFIDNTQSSTIDASAAGLDFFNFNSTTPDKVLIFTAGDTFNINGTWTLDPGTSVEGDEIVLQSSTPGSLWFVNPAAVNIQDVSVQDSFNFSSFVSVIAPGGDSEDLGNNFNWFSASGAFIWTGATSNDWSVNTNWSGNVAPTPGDSAFIPNVANDPFLTALNNELVNLTILGGGILDLGGNNLDITSLLNNFGTLDASTGSPTLSLNDLLIGPGGTLIAPDGTGIFTVSGDWTNTGLFDSNGGTVDFNGMNGPGETQTINNPEANGCFFNLIHSGNEDLILASELCVLNDLTNSSGTFTSGANPIDVGNNFTNSPGATFQAPSSTMTVGGDWTNSNPNVGSFDPNGGTVDFNGPVSTIQILTNLSPDCFFNLAHSGESELVLATEICVLNDLINSNGTFTSGANPIEVGNDFTNSPGATFQAPSTIMTVGGDWTNAGTFNANGGTVDFTNPIYQTVDSPPINGCFFNLTHSGAGTLELLSAICIDGNLTNGPGVIDITGNDVTVGGNVSNDGTFIVRGDETVTFANGNDEDSGTFMFVGDGNGLPTTFNLFDFGPGCDYFNLVINATDNILNPPFVTDTFVQNLGTEVCGLTTVLSGILSIVPPPDGGLPDDVFDEIFRLYPNGTYFDYLDDFMWRVEDLADEGDLSSGAGLLGRFPQMLYVTTVDGVAVGKLDLSNFGKAFEWRETPSGIFASQNGPEVYVLMPRSNRMFVLNSSTVPKSVYGLKSGLSEVILGPDGKTAYVSNALSDTLQVIDLKTKKVKMTIPTGSMPQGIALSPDGRHIYVTNSLDNRVSKIDTLTGAILQTAPTGESPYGLWISPDGLELYVTDTAAGKVFVLSTGDLSKISEILVGKSPYMIRGDQEGKRLFVSNRGSDTVSIIDTADKLELAQVKVGSRPTGLALAPGGKTLYVANELSKSISLVDTQKMDKIGEVKLDFMPSRLAIGGLSEGKS